MHCGQDVNMLMGGILLAVSGFFLMRFIFLFLFFFPATRVKICSQPVRETCNQFGMAQIGLFNFVDMVHMIAS